MTDQSDDYTLPWQTIDRLTPQIGGGPVYVWNGKRMMFAIWKYGWDPTDCINQPSWCDGSISLDPQPTHWLPLSPPKSDS